MEKTATQYTAQQNIDFVTGSVIMMWSFCADFHFYGKDTYLSWQSLQGGWLWDSILKMTQKYSRTLNVSSIIWGMQQELRACALTTQAREMKVWAMPNLPEYVSSNLHRTLPSYANVVHVVYYEARYQEWITKQDIKNGSGTSPLLVIPCLSMWVRD